MTQVRPYGDTPNDGRIQLSFTLPIPAGYEADLAALKMCEGMSLANPQIAHRATIGNEHTFFVVYASVMWAVPIVTVQNPTPESLLTIEEIDDLIGASLQRSIRVIGACTGSDAHTVGIDAILNIKGFKGDPGLERYRGFEVTNLGSQVSNSELVDVIKSVKPDAVLISQVVTHHDAHLRNLTALLDMLEVEQLRDTAYLVVGGPRITLKLALELGFDYGFGAETSPSQVANHLAKAICTRR